MNQTTVIDKINDLGYQGLKEAYLRQTEDVNYSRLGFDERLYNLLEAQEIFTHNKRIATNLRQSKIKDKQASMEGLEYHNKRRLNKTVIKDLANMNFIRNHQNIIITGKTGTGKSYVAQALANRSILDGFKAYYTRVPTLLEEIKISRADGTYTNLLRKYSRFELLVLDDFGVSAMHADDATNLFEIIEDRTEINSTIITSQLPVSQWYEYLNNDTVADAILDRIVHSSHRLELEGESMRKLRSNINKSE
ncbi:MAG: IS21-like element helper ATPase IstB [Sulfurovum sp.]|jgi:DNA replication protein DnaC